MIALTPSREMSFFGLLFALPDQVLDAVVKQVEIRRVVNIRFHHERIHARGQILTLMPDQLMAVFHDQQNDLADEFGSQEIDIANQGAPFVLAMRIQMAVPEELSQQAVPISPML